MSFSTSIITELMEAELHKTCCKKALVFGLFFGAITEGENAIKAEFRSLDIANKAAEILKKQFSATPLISEVKRAGRKFYVVSATTKAIHGFLKRADSEERGDISALVGFRCPECSHAFLRGVFMATGTVSDPQKSYHLEFSFSNPSRARILEHFLEREISAAKTVTRGAKTGLYYKKNMTIADILYYLGGVQSGFDFANTCIEHDIRNIENRATNCVARNISRSVEASVKQIGAIEAIRKRGKLQKLGEELRYTARLRIENPSLTLSELALIHEPPISKSGLNRRLTKIMEEAQKLEKTKQ